MKIRKPLISILAIEDVDEMRGLLKHLLKGISGVRVSGVAKNGFEARLEVSRRRPDLIFLDEVLPGESSLDLLREFYAQKIPVVLITSLENPFLGLPEGAVGRLAKPGWKSLEEDRIRFQSFLFRGSWSSEA